MLKVTGHAPCHGAIAEIGRYVPLEIRCPTDGEPTRCYWRTGNLDTTLLEIAIDGSDGQIIGASLLLPGAISTRFPELILPTDRLSGFPLASEHEWQGGTAIDDAADFSVFADRTRLLVKLSDEYAIRSIVSGNVLFGVSVHGLLSWILAIDLPVERLNDLAAEFRSQ